jgi:isopentenyl phosphate kinase
MNPNLIFVKLGGSLITDKDKRATAHRRIIRRLANELRRALAVTPALHIILGHGSGSFGHWVAKRYHTQERVESEHDWRGFAEVSAAACRLNRIVVDTFLESGVPVLSLQPSSAIRARDGKICTYPLNNLKTALENHIVPLIFGDVAFDEVKGGTILSTEALFAFAAERLQPDWIVLLGNTPGVLNVEGQVVPTITPTTYAEARSYLSGSRAIDVTGGMVDKVSRMIELTRRHPNIRIRILSGREPEALFRALVDPDTASGTLIRDDDIGAATPRSDTAQPHHDD